MNIKRLISLAIAISYLEGCAGIKNPFSPNGNYSGISPPTLHTYDKNLSTDEPLSNLTEKIKNAEKDPFERYYAAQLLAKDSGTQKNINAYLEAGVVLVNVTCSRWFRSLSEAEIRFNFAQGNQNVIQDLATTALGIAKANPITVATAGAGFTALNGFEKMFSQSFFLAPNANKVKSHIFAALDTRKKELLYDTNRQAPHPTTYGSAYEALELYGGICTQQTAREIINSSLDQTQTLVSTEAGGKVITTVTAQALKASQATSELRFERDQAVNAATSIASKQIEDLNKKLLTKESENEGLKSAIAVSQTTQVAAVLPTPVQQKDVPIPIVPPSTEPRAVDVLGQSNPALRFDFGEPRQKGPVIRLWATHYNAHFVKLDEAGIDLLDKQDRKLGVKISPRDFCLGAIEGTIQVINAGLRRTFNYASTGNSELASCETVLKIDKAAKPSIVASGKSRFEPAKGAYGDGVNGLILVPFRTIAVDPAVIPIGSSIYVPSAKGQAVLWQGEKYVHDGYFFAADIGGAIEGNHIDIFCGDQAINCFRNFVSSSIDGQFDAYIVSDRDTVETLRSAHQVNSGR